MTHQELENLRLNCRINAVEFVLVVLLNALSRSPDARQQLVETLNLLPQRVSESALRGVPPEYSDLANAEAHDAAESLISFLTSVLNHPSRK